MLSIRSAIALVGAVQGRDPGMGVMTPAPTESIVVNEQSRGRAFPGSLTVGGGRLRSGWEMSVLDCSMIQLQFSWRGPSGNYVFLAHPAQILFDGFLADCHLLRHGFHWQTGCVQLQRTPFLMTERWPADGVIGGEDVGETGGNPVPACGDLLDRRTYLVSLLAFQRVAPRSGLDRRANGGPPRGWRPRCGPGRSRRRGQGRAGPRGRAGPGRRAARPRSKRCRRRGCPP